MKNNLGLKLIAVINVNTLKLYEAQGLKITKQIGDFNIAADTDHRQEKHQGFTKKKSVPGSFFDPHTQTKQIEQQESSKEASNQIASIYNKNNEYKELIIVSEPQMLGFIRKENKLKDMITREVKKDLVNHDLSSIEKAIFA
ncbi:MAG: host attachment protein [Rickettsiaceae bacterium]|nr:host attachment protein [Rickettsiaceae bacterium]